MRILWAAPFAADALPPGPAVSGAPAVVLFGSSGWYRNHDGAAWFVRRSWPRVRERLPAAILHVFGIGAGLGAHGRAIVERTAPLDSVTNSGLRSRATDRSSRVRWPSMNSRPSPIAPHTAK